LAGIFWLTAILGLATLALVYPPDGVQRSTLAQFVGRFHPLVVHLPIALIALLPVIEACALFRRGHHLRGAADFLLWIATASAIGGTTLGWVLAFNGGYVGELVNDHMWSGCILSFFCLFALLLRRRWAQDGWRSAGVLYLPVLLATVGLMSWTAHQGGQLTHGETYLTEHMPAKLRAWLGMPEAKTKRPKPDPSSASLVGAQVEAGEPSFYAQRIAPAFERTCVPCHKEDKKKADLRMDTYALLMQGGESGPAVVPGKLAESELYRRITLPHDDEEFMPSGGKPPLTAEETKWVEQWIAAGASETAPSSLATSEERTPVGAGQTKSSSTPPAL